jgi:hypothetical protein
MAPKMTREQFENSPLDIEPKGVKEGSPEDMALDRKQMKAATTGKGRVAAPRFAEGGKVDDPLQRAVERNSNLQGLELIQKDLDKPQLNRPSSEQYMREHGYPNRFDVPAELRTAPRFAEGGMVKHGSSTSINCKSKG